MAVILSLVTDAQVVGIEQETYTVSEVDGSVEVCAILVRDIPIGATRVTLTTLDGGAAGN